RNRLLLARLFTRPFNLLVLDEPTNDLDVETLELLESLLVDFEGTLLLVSHDRAFLDNVVSSTLVMEGGGRVGEYAGGYDDWLLQRRPSAEESEAAKASREAKKPDRRAEKKAAAADTAKPRKLSYRERQDLETLPARIEALETRQTELHATLSDPELYRSNDGEAVVRLNDELTEVGKDLEAAYERWAELEALAE
ncbi:MAG: ABC transporter ATP-binding protein, partial [Acidobacteria bacterium]|nr:ABC transporter ATP-binding protein [Acidobacteriota bacterium]